MNRFLWLLAAFPLLQGETVHIRTSELPWAIVNTAYQLVIQTEVDGVCPQGDVELSLSDGTLPRGLEIKGGTLSGIPKETGRFHFSVLAENNCDSSLKGLELVVTGKPILRAYPEALVCKYQSGQASPAPLTVQVSSTWPELPYSVQVGAGWLTRKGGGVTPDKDSGLAADLVSLEIDPKNLAPGIYRTFVKFYARSGANAPAVAVTLKVVAEEQVR